jgi:hypothetical protein
MNFPPINLVQLLAPWLREVPPWLVLSALAGAVSASAFYLMAGRGFRSLPTYLVLGLAVAPICQALAVELPPLPPPLTIGEVDLVVVAGGTWGFLAIARALRL